MKTVVCGSSGESAAAAFLIEKGFDIECMNYHSRFGEIDIIASDDKYLLFVEVKTRSQESKASPADSVIRSKQQKIMSTALIYLNLNSTELQPRFDVIEVYIKSTTDFKVLKIEHIENAFGTEVGHNAIF